MFIKQSRYGAMALMVRSHRANQGYTLSTESNFFHSNLPLLAYLEPHRLFSPFLITPRMLHLGCMKVRVSKAVKAGLVPLLNRKKAIATARQKSVRTAQDLSLHVTNTI